MTDETIITKQETTEVIASPNTKSTAPALDDIFSKIEAGKEEGKSAKDVLSEQPKTQEKQAAKPEVKPEKKEVKPEVKPEVKIEEKVDDTDPRNALKRAFEAKEQEKVEAKKEEKVEQADDVPEDELAVLPHDKPKTAKRIQKLLDQKKELDELVTKTRAETKEKADKLLELEKKLGDVKSVDPKVQEEVKKQQDELAMYRRRYELDRDPEVKTKFDDRVVSAEEAIVTTLKKRNAGEALLKLINEEGGWSGFAASNRQISIPDGEGGNKSVSGAELAEIILQQLPLPDRKSVEAAMMEQVQTKRDKDRYFKEEQAKANKFFEERDQITKKQQEEQQKVVDTAKKTIEDWKKGVESSDWLKDKTVASNSSPEEKSEVDAWNKQNQQLKQILNNNLSAQKLEDYLPIVQESVLYYAAKREGAALQRENIRLKAELAKKEEEFSRFKTAGRSVPRAGSISVASPSKNGGGDKRVIGLEAALSAIEDGIDPRTGERNE